MFLILFFIMTEVEQHAVNHVIRKGDTTSKA